MAPTAASRRQVTARRLALEPAFASVPRHFAADGDLITSHLVAALSAVFPDGEDFFVRSVKRYRDEITDPELKRQVAGFIGQEVTHGREHRAFNARLDGLGYHTQRVETLVRRLIAFRERHLPPIANLASTAALEHVTATLAEVVMRSPEAQQAFGHEAVKHLFLWHALEESEHKAVAFDVYRTVGGSERMRILTMRLVRWTFAIGTALQVVVSLLSDRAAYRPGELRASWRRLRRHPFLSRSVWNQLRGYERPGFHPDDRPTDDLVDAWRERLFGQDGQLRYATRGAAVAS